MGVGLPYPFSETARNSPGTSPSSANDIRRKTSARKLAREHCAVPRRSDARLAVNGKWRTLNVALTGHRASSGAHCTGFVPARPMVAVREEHELAHAGTIAHTCRPLARCDVEPLVASSPAANRTGSGMKYRLSAALIAPPALCALLAGCSAR